MNADCHHSRHWKPCCRTAVVFSGRLLFVRLLCASARSNRDPAASVDYYSTVVSKRREDDTRRLFRSRARESRGTGSLREWRIRLGQLVESRTPTHVRWHDAWLTNFFVRIRERVFFCYVTHARCRSNDVTSSKNTSPPRRRPVECRTLRDGAAAVVCAVVNKPELQTRAIRDRFFFSFDFDRKRSTRELLFWYLAVIAWY